MKSILFTTLFLCSAITAMAETFTYHFGGVDYTITYNNLQSLYVTDVTPIPSTDNFTFPEGFKGLSSNVMQGSTSKIVSLNTIITLDNNSFKNNTHITTIEGDAVTTVKSSCFEGCTSLTTVNMPQTTSIASSAFRGCVALSSINLGCIPSNESAFADCNFATTKPTIRVKCENTDENKISLTTIFGVSEWAYDSESGVMYAVYSEPVTKYSINISNSIVNGRVEADAETAAAGTLVTLTATPSDDYLLVEFIVTDAESNSVTVSDDGKFTMPANDVTISAIFAKNTVTATCGAINVDDAEIVVAGNKIVASGNGVLTVYDILGKQVLSAEVSGREAVALAKGIYIVKFAGKTTKIVLK